MVLMSVWELVLLRLGGSESVGVVLNWVDFVLVVLLKAARLKLPVVLKRAVASRILAGQRLFQEPVINCCLTTQPSCRRTNPITHSAKLCSAVWQPYQVPPPSPQQNR